MFRSLGLQLKLPKSASIVVLTGAGISKESGLDTFRDKDGIWSKVKLEDVATPEGFAADPERVQAFYNSRRENLLSGNVKPNAAHDALAELERAWRGEFLLVTQNIDDLHESAGSKNLIHMHGELLNAKCLSCGRVCPCPHDIKPTSSCPYCHERGVLRPDVVWFGEIPYQMERIYDALTHCRLFISIGTSGSVFPAAGFVHEVNRSEHGRAVELNMERSENASLFVDSRYGPATEVVPAFVKELLSNL